MTGYDEHLVQLIASAIEADDYAAGGTDIDFAEAVNRGASFHALSLLTDLDYERNAIAVLDQLHRAGYVVVPTS